MSMFKNLRPASRSLRLTLAIALMAVVSSGYLVFVAAIDARSSFEVALARPPLQLPCSGRTSVRGPVSFATATR